MDIHREDLAWAAGFYEGEGHVRAQRLRKTYVHLSLEVGQVDLEPLERLQRIFGVGRLYRHQAKNPRWQPMHHWTVYRTQNVIAIMTALRPWLSLRRQRQWDGALLIWANRGKRPRQLKMTRRAEKQRQSYLAGRGATIKRRAPLELRVVS